MRAVGHGAFVVLWAVLMAAVAGAQQRDPVYDQVYDQVGGYGVGTLDERVAKLEKKLSGETLMEMLSRIEQLQGDVLRMRGEIEELTHALETLKKQQKDMYADLDHRLQESTNAAAAKQQPAPAETPPSAPEAAPAMQSGAAGTKASPPPVPAPPPTPQKPAPAGGGDAAGRQAAYQKAFNTLKEGRYSDAVKEFKGFLAAYPSGEYVDNASYWLAEAYYVNRDFSSARDSFRKVVKEFPQSSKVSDSLLKIGFIEYETGQWASAREILNDVMKRYPDTSAAKLAEKRLAKMKQEGH